MIFEHVRQPNDYTCGAAALAIVTGCSVDEAIAVLRPTPGRGTQHKRLIRALMDRGVRCGPRFVSARCQPLPRTAIVRVIYPNKRGHVVVKRDRTWFDPLLAGPFTGLPPDCVITKTINWSNGGRIASSLWLEDGMP